MNLVGRTEQLPPALVTTSGPCKFGLSIKSDELEAAQELKAFLFIYYLFIY